MIVCFIPPQLEQIHVVIKISSNGTCYVSQYSNDIFSCEPTPSATVFLNKFQDEARND